MDVLQQQLKEQQSRSPAEKVVCIFRFRFISYFLAQPASFSFILSLFLISITLFILGNYVSKSDHMPDLDAMKNWNAYTGKLSKNDFCFHLAGHYNGSFQTLLHNNSIFKDSKDGRCFYGYSKQGNVTVAVAMNFTVEKEVIINSNMNAMFSRFNGKAVGTQIQNKTDGTRIDSSVYLQILLEWTDLNIDNSCDSSQCIIPGCFLITAPLLAVPTRMPQVHGDFTFESKVLNSSVRRSPNACKCNNFVSGYNYSIGIYNLSEDCSSSSQVLQIMNKNQRRTRGYGIIWIELNTDDKKKASQHMYLAALTVAALGTAFAIGILLTDRPVTPKNSQE